MWIGYAAADAAQVDLWSEFLKGAVTVPITVVATIASAWVAFRWATQQGEMERFTAQLGLVRSAAAAVTERLSEMVDGMTSPVPPTMATARGPMRTLLLHLMDEALTADALARRLPRRWRGTATRMTGVALLGASRAVDIPVQAAPPGPALQWIQQWHDGIKGETWAAESMLVTWQYYRSLGWWAARRRAQTDFEKPRSSFLDHPGRRRGGVRVTRLFEGSLGDYLIDLAERTSKERQNQPPKD